MLASTVNVSKASTSLHCMVNLLHNNQNRYTFAAPKHAEGHLARGPTTTTHQDKIKKKGGKAQQSCRAANKRLQSAAIRTILCATPKQKKLPAKVAPFFLD